MFDFINFIEKENRKMTKYKFVYEDTERKIEQSLGRGNSLKQRMYWRGFSFALFEYDTITSSELQKLYTIINDKYAKGKSEQW